MKKIKTILLLATLCTTSYAGLNGLTNHSRANCLNINESISWDATTYRAMKVTSQHWKGTKKKHMDERQNTDKNPTWRTAVVHADETKDNQKWVVVGTHYLLIKGKWMLVEQTQAVDCSIYDGWWDKDHPEWGSYA